MNMREELTPTVLKIRELAERYTADPALLPSRDLAHILAGLADEIETVLWDLPSRKQASPIRLTACRAA